MTASIIAVVGVGTQTVKLLRKLASFRNAPVLARALDNELSAFRSTILAIQDLFEALQSSHDVGLGRDTIASINSSLKQAESLVVELEGLLNPLLAIICSDSAAKKSRFRWIKEEKKLKALKQELHNVRLTLDNALGILSL